MARVRGRPASTDVFVKELLHAGVHVTDLGEEAPRRTDPLLERGELPDQPARHEEQYQRHQAALQTAQTRDLHRVGAARTRLAPGPGLRRGRPLRLVALRRRLRTALRGRRLLAVLRRLLLAVLRRLLRGRRT